MASEHTLTFTNENFKSEVLDSSVPVLVDFWAEWCGPCLMLAPVVDELARDYAGKIKVGKVDIDKAERISAQFNVMNIPTLILFEKGQPVERVVGVRSKKELSGLLNKHLGVTTA